MSVELLHELKLTDSDFDTATFRSAPVDEDVDWSDENEAILASVQIRDHKVNITRADLDELVSYLVTIQDEDAAVFAVEEDEDAEAKAA